MTYNDRNRADQRFSPAEVCCEKEDNDGYRNRRNRTGEFSFANSNNDNELYREAQEKEEVELEEGNVDLKCQIPPLHP